MSDDRRSPQTEPSQAALTVAFLAIARPTFDVPLAQQTAETATRTLIDAGYRLTGSGSQLLMDVEAAAAAVDALADSECDLVILFQATFADSSMATTMAKSMRQRAIPLLLWSVPEARDGGRLRLNSLCGINLAAHAFKLNDIDYAYLHAAADASHGVQAAIEPLARAGHAARGLRRTRIGLFGQAPTGFETCAYDRDHLRTLFGLEVQYTPLPDLFQTARNAEPDLQEHFIARAVERAPNVTTLDAVAVSGTASVYAALRQTVMRDGLAGVAVRCWPEFFTDLGCAACGAMSMLGDEGCPASCEADVNGTVTSLLLQMLSGDAAFLADLVSLDVEQDNGVLWHCGLAPASMADPASAIAGTVHSNRKLPLLFEFPLKPGRVTLARLHRAGLDQGLADYSLVIAGAVMLAADKSFGGTSGVVQFDRPAGAVLDAIMAHGLEHHYSLVYGDQRPALCAFARLTGLPLIDLTA